MSSRQSTLENFHLQGARVGRTGLAPTAQIQSEERMLATWIGRSPGDADQIWRFAPCFGFSIEVGAGPARPLDPPAT